MASESSVQALLNRIGDRLRVRRRSLGLTQERLAEIAYLSPTYLAKLEAGQRSPSLETLIDLCRALGIEPADMLGKQTDTNVTAERLSIATFGLQPEDLNFLEQMVTYTIAHLQRRR